MNEIIKNELVKEMSYQNEVILKYRIEFPQIGSTSFQVGKTRFNEFYRQKATELKTYAENELYKMAVDSYEFAKKNDYPIMQYELVLEYTVTYNEICVVSIYLDQYTFTGGAHGNTVRSSQTWNLKNGDMLTLNELFNSNDNYIIDILKEINLQIANEISIGENYYFDNYSELLVQNFNPQSFYLTPLGVAIYYQQYDIAPYSSGIPTFVINYNIMPINLPYCY